MKLKPIQKNGRWLDPFRGRAETLPGTDGPWGLLREMARDLEPGWTLHETDRQVVVHTRAPGMDETDLEITVRGNVLTVRGEKTVSVDEDARGVHTTSVRAFSSSTTLPCPVTAREAAVSCEDGVLKIVLNKGKSAETEIVKNKR